MEKISRLENPEEKIKSSIGIVKDGEGKLADLVMIEGNKNISFKEFIPPNVKLESGYAFGYDSLKKILHFRPERINSLAGKLALLHEIGHATDFNKHPEIAPDQTFLEIWKKFQGVAFKLYADAPLEILKNKEEYEAYLLENMSKKFKELNIPAEQLSEFIKSLVRNERTAWAEALKLYRKIKKENGIDLLDGEKNKDIIKAIEDPLGGYDKAFRQLVPEQQVKLFLVKKFSEEGKK